MSKIALAIGNNQYDDPKFSLLTTPTEDVNTFSSALRDPNIGAFDDVVSLTNQSCEDVRLAIADLFASKRPDDLLVLYFSGHGIRDEQGRLFLAVSNTRPNRLSATAIPSSYITDEMDNCRSRRQVLILDCCYSGAFARGYKGALGTSVGTQSAFEGSGYGRVVLTATDSTQYAWEGEKVIGEAEKSIFTHCLTQGLLTGDADLDGDGLISIDELYDYVYELVTNSTSKQTPGKWSYKQHGNLHLAKNPQPKKLPFSVPQEIVEPLAQWAKQSGYELNLAKIMGILDLSTKALPTSITPSQDSKIIDTTKEISPLDILGDPKSKWYQILSAIYDVRKSPNIELIPAIEPFVNHIDPDISTAARQTIEFIRDPKKLKAYYSTLEAKSQEVFKDSSDPPRKVSLHQQGSMQTIKLIITGPFGAGKTEFIQSVSEIDVVSTERKISAAADHAIKEATTVQMDFGRITVDEDLVMYLFGTPGQKRFDFMWEILAEGMLGFIVIVDSTIPETFREARVILETFRSYAPVPYIIVANKQDLENAWDIEDIRKALRLDKKEKLLPCVATDSNAVKSVLLELLYLILAEAKY